MDPSQLVVGDTYFMVTYPDPSMTTPVIITYRFLGRDPEGVQEDEPGPHYYFRLLPAFHFDEDGESNRSLESDWESVFPGAFHGWGELVPTSFSEEKVRHFVTLDGLIEELTAIRARSRRR